MKEDLRAEPAGNSRELTLATLSFAICFYTWALLGPLGPVLQDQLGLSEGELALAVSISIVLGPLMRISVGVPFVNKWYVLTDSNSCQDVGRRRSP